MTGFYMRATQAFNGLINIALFWGKGGPSLQYQQVDLVTSGYSYVRKIFKKQCAMHFLYDVFFYGGIFNFKVT